MARGRLFGMLIASWLGLSAAAWGQPLPPSVKGPPTAVPAPAEAAPLLPGPEAFGPPGPCAPEPCCPPEPQPPNFTCFHVGFEYLLWYSRKDRLPALLTTGSFNDPRPAALGRPSTQIVLQGNQLDDDRHSGARLTLGVGLDNSIDWSALASFFVLERTGQSFSAAGNGAAFTPVLARPFFNVVAAEQDSDPIAVPLIASGTISFNYDRRIYGGDANLRYLYIDDDNHQIRFLLGGRVFWLTESLAIAMTSQDLPGLGVQGNTYYLRETFQTQNIFYGGQVGLDHEFRVGPVSITTVAKCALGAVRQTQENRANTRIVEPTGISTSSNDRALYVSPNNAGQFTRTRFGAMPEGSIKFGFDFNEYVRFSLGYTGMYLDQALRVARGIDQRVNIQPIGTNATFAPTAARPAYDTSGFWVQGIDASIRFSF